MAARHRLKLGLVGLAWPIFIEEVTAGLVLAADTWFLSRIGDVAAASVGSLGSVLMLGYFILPQFSTAGTAVASQYMGAGRDEAVVPTWIGNLVISVGLGLVLSVALFCCAPYVGLWLGMTAGEAAYAAEFLGVIAFAFVLVGARGAYASVLASRTLTSWTMSVAVVTNALNIALNALFMSGAFGLPRLGVRGVALASLLAYLVGLLLLVYLVHRRLGVSFRIPRLVPRVRAVLGPILRIGVPAALEPFSWVMQSFVVTVLIIGLGLEAMAANTYMQRLIFLDMAVTWSLTAAGQIVMSHMLGAGRLDAVKRTYWKVLAISAAFAFVNMAAFLAFHDAVLGIFTADAGIKRIGFWLLVISLFTEPIRAANILGGVALKTVGDGRFSLVVGVAFMWGVIPVIVASNALGWGVIGLYAVLLLDETVRAAVNVIRWARGSWVGKAVISAAEGDAPAAALAKLP
ncbi:MAG TPA: MATE family efflux transporter [Anaeromyxobacter sp.]|nr:MATE family efflux transporter [Anaeromyxobacter sp.]